MLILSKGFAKPLLKKNRGSIIVVHREVSYLRYAQAYKKQYAEGSRLFHSGDAGATAVGNFL